MIGGEIGLASFAYASIRIDRVRRVILGLYRVGLSIGINENLYCQCENTQRLSDIICYAILHLRLSSSLLLFRFLRPFYPDNHDQ